jgi:hypothetical protein
MNDNQIDVLDDNILSTSTSKYLKSINGISPVVSCCAESPAPGADSQCKVGNWIPVDGAGGKGYCSTTYTTFAEAQTAYSKTSASARGVPFDDLTLDDFCKAFPESGNCPPSTTEYDPNLQNKHK